MSEYMALKAQIEELTGRLEAVKREELAAEITDIRKRIIAFGIEPKDLFPDLPAPRKSVPRKNRKPKPSIHPPKFAWHGHTWTGIAGPKPQWYTDALASGVTDEQMAAEARRLNGAAG